MAHVEKCVSMQQYFEQFVGGQRRVELKSVRSSGVRQEAHSPVMCEIEISNCRKINLIIAYWFIFVLREEHLENAFA